MNDHSDNQSLDRLADALVGWAGSGMLIIDHMSRAATRGKSEGAPVTDVFRRIVRDTLGPLADRHDADALATAAAIAVDAVETLASEIYRVDLDADDTRPF